MTANGKCFARHGERGNALIYVLVLIALFAALTFVLSRQRGSSETGTVSSEAINIDAGQIIQVSNQVKQAVDQMLYSGSSIDNLDFCQPGDVCFASAGIHSVFAPQGGGVVMPQIPTDAVKQVDTNPVPGWYMGAFNNVEWTPNGPAGPAGCVAAGSCPVGCPGAPPACAAYTDVILVAHQITQPVCEKIDELLTGTQPVAPATSIIPAASVPLATILIDGSKHSGGTADFDAAVCPGCNGRSSLCVSDAGATMFSFYNVIEQR